MFVQGNRVRINAPGHDWHQLHAIVQELTDDGTAIVSVTAHGLRGRYAFAPSELVTLCSGSIAGHNGCYSFPCVLDNAHDGPCNRTFPSGGPCDACGCGSHQGEPCTGAHCGSAPCRAGLSWDAWYEQFHTATSVASHNS